MTQFSDDEITDETVHDLAECPKCGSHNLEEIGETIKDEFDYEVKVSLF